VIGWLVEALIASTLLMALVMLVRAPVRNAFGPQVAYALWALPLLRLLLPPLPAAWQEVAATPISRASDTLTILVADGAVHDTVAPVAVAAPAIGWIVGLLWAAGALGFLVWHLTSHRRHCRRLLGTAASIEEVRGVHIIASEAAAGPLAFGVMRRYVAFPLDFADRYDADERELALEHEIGHHQRGDLIANWIALGVLALHWFDPVAFRAFRADQELANDARVLTGRSTIDRHAYACAIVKAAHGGAVSAACHLHTIDDLKGRLRMLSTSPRSRRRLALGGALVSTVVLGGLGVTASGTSAAAAISHRVGNTMGIDLQAASAAMDMPEMREMPEMPTMPDAATPAPNVHRVVVKRIAEKDGRDDGADTAATVQDGRPDRREVRAMVYRSMRNVPEVSERNCSVGRDGEAQRFVVQGRDGGKRTMVICTNRIQAAAAASTAAAVNAADIRRNAMKVALASVEASRASLAANQVMPVSGRKEALAEMDSALAELRAEMASPDED
jgi:bla regulator protein BlaR1